MNLFEKLKHQKNLKFVLIMFIILILLVYFVLPNIIPFLEGNILLTYISLELAYAFLVMHFIFDKPPISNLRKVIQFIFFSMALSLIFFPYFLSDDPTFSTDKYNLEAKLSDEIMIYDMLPDSFSNSIKYFITYIIMPIVLLITSFSFSKKKIISNYIEEGMK